MIKKEEFIFCPLGGSGEIGMNMNLFAYGKPENRKWIIVDIGVTFADDTIPGIDLIYPDPGFIVDKRNDLLGLVLTHAHEDHIGAIAHIWPKLLCDIYATPFTSVLIREKFKEKKINLGNKLKIVELNGDVTLGPFKIEFVTLTHSILEPNGLSITTDSGTVLHTGDWKIDPNPLIGEKVNEKRLKKIGDEGILAMICDSTNVFNPGRAGSESDVRSSLLKIMQNRTKRIIVTSFASNVARMESIFYCAEKIGRHISLVGRSMHRIYNAAKQCGYLNGLRKPIDPRDAKKIERKKILYLCTGSQGEPNGAMKRISNYTHPDVFVEAGDTVIFSSKIIPGNEKKLFALFNKLSELGASVITEYDEDIHVSGHPCLDEVKDMYNYINPSISIPVHGEHRHLKRHSELANEIGIKHPMLIGNGDIVQLSPGSPHIFDQCPSGRLYLDGNRLVSSESFHISERRKISYSGVLFITCLVNKKFVLKEEPSLFSKGVFGNNMDEEDIIYQLEEEIYRFFDDKNNLKKKDKKINQKLETLSRNFIYKHTGKKPLTNINIIHI